MPARNLPLLNSVLSKESNVGHVYENHDFFTRSGYAYGSHGTGSLAALQDKVSTQHAVHLPSVNTGSATSTRGRSTNTGTGDGPVLGLSFETALEQFSRQMSSYEQREISNYPHVYFIGLSAIKRPGVAGAPNNDGYDDEHGSYIQVYILCVQMLNFLLILCDIWAQMSIHEGTSVSYYYWFKQVF